MRTINLSEESYNKLKESLIKESSYGNNDLSSFYEDLELAFRDFYSIIREHYIMLERMRQQPDEKTAEIKNHADAIGNLIAK